MGNGGWGCGGKRGMYLCVHECMRACVRVLFVVVMVVVG